METVRLAEIDRLLLTREAGREVAEQIPEAAELVLDFEDVDVASTSFLDELLKVLVEQRGTVVSVAHVRRTIARNLARLERVTPDRRIREIA